MRQLADIRDAVQETAVDYDIDRVYLFGSHARGSAHESSDIDLCLETGASFSLFNAGDMARRLEEALSAPVDMVTERALYRFVREGCLADRVLIYERA